MMIKGAPYYTYSFGSMGTTLETAGKTELFQWFHLQATERYAEGPGEVARFRPEGPAFHDRCYLDAMIGPSKELVRMELVVRRSFIDSRDAPFAQDLVKSFLHAALPQACQHVLADFMRDVDLPGHDGLSEGFMVFKGKRTSWEILTGWSRLILTNTLLPDGPALVVQVGPNPKAPNARLVAN